MSDLQAEELTDIVNDERNIENYFPFTLPIKIVPMFFQHNLVKKTLVMKIQVFLKDSDFNTYGESFSLLDDAVAFSGSLYEGLTASPELEQIVSFMNATAREVAGFETSDSLVEIKIDSNERFIEITGENSNDLLGDPSRYFGDAQGKFEKLKVRYPQLPAMIYQFAISVFAQRIGEKQRFYQAVLEQAMKG